MARTKKAKTVAKHGTTADKRQVGGSNPVHDKFRGAKPAGWRRVTHEGAPDTWYYENRRNRSDTDAEIKNHAIYKAFKEAEKKAEAARKAAHKAAKAVKPKTTKAKAPKKAQPRK